MAGGFGWENQLDPMTAMQLEASRRALADAEFQSLLQAAPSEEPGAQAPPPMVMPSAGFDPNQLDPMTAAERGNSASTIADARMRTELEPTIAAQMTGIPGMHRGVGQAIQGYQDGNPMGIAKGAAVAATSALPWTRAFSKAPVTALGAMFAAPNIDTTMPSAAAATPEMPPLPTQKNAPVAPPQQDVQPQAQQGPAETFFNQVGTNLKKLGGFASGVYDDVGRMLSASGEYKPPTYEEWIKGYGASQLKAVEEAEAKAGQNVEGVNAREARRIRESYRDQAAKMRSELQGQYKSFVEDQKQAHKARQNQRFDQRYPYASAGGQIIPAVVAGKMYHGALKRHGKAIREKTAEVGSKGAAASRAAQDELLELTAKTPSPWGYVGGGAAGGAFMKGVGDAIDATTLPFDSEARQRAKLAYFPVNEQGEMDWSEIPGTISGYAGRGLMAAGGVGVGHMFGRRHIEPALMASARRAAGLPSTAAADIRGRTAQELREIDAANYVHRGGVNTVLRDEFGMAPLPNRPQTALPAPTRQIEGPPPGGFQSAAPPPPGGFTGTGQSLPPRNPNAGGALTKRANSFAADPIAFIDANPGTYLRGKGSKLTPALKEIANATGLSVADVKAALAGTKYAP